MQIFDLVYFNNEKNIFHELNRLKNDLNSHAARFNYP